MRKMCLQMVYELAKQDERVVFVGSDLGRGTLDSFKNSFPERFFMEGVSEQNLVGVAAGMALSGHIVYVNTIATFLTRRCFEQNVLDLGLHKANVRLIGNGGGLVYAPLGPTHLAIEDIALMRAIPNMTVVACADANEMRYFMKQTIEWDGPIYIRLAKGGDPIITEQNTHFAIGRGILMREGEDVLFVTTGITLQMALEAAQQMEAEGISTAVLHMPTIKPLDKRSLLECAEKVKCVVTIEEHVASGGLGSAVAEIMVESISRSSFKPMKRLGLPDLFVDSYGSQASLLEHYGVTSGNAVATAKHLLGKCASKFFPLSRGVESG